MKGVISDKKSIALTLVASLVIGLFGGVQSARMAGAAENQTNLNGIQHSISNEVIRHAAKTAGEGESAYAYYYDFNNAASSADLNKVATASSGGSLELKNDIQYGGYLKHIASKGNRSMVMNFASDKNDVAKLDNYTVEMDVALKPGTEAGAQSELVFTDDGFDDKVIDSAVSKNYIYKLSTGEQAASAAKAPQKRNRAVTGRAWYINNGTKQVKLSEGIWVTIRLSVTTDSSDASKTLKWEIIQRGTEVKVDEGESIKLGKGITAGKLKGLYILTGKGGEALVDNIRVSRYSETVFDYSSCAYEGTISVKDAADRLKIDVKEVQWYRTEDKNSDGTAIKEATGVERKLSKEDAGKFVYAVINGKTRIFFANRVQGQDIKITDLKISKSYDGETAISNEDIKKIAFALVTNDEPIADKVTYDASQLTFDSAAVGEGKKVTGKLMLTGVYADCYNLINGGRIDTTGNIVKGRPDYEKYLTSVITAKAGQTLSEVNLPPGFTWNEPTTNVGTTLGEKKFPATYTPPDTNNYEKLTEIPIAVVVVDGSYVVPSAQPSGSPTASASVRPSGSPMPSASIRPSGNPSARPSASVRPSASIRPSASPTATPRRTATPRPTGTPVEDNPYPDDPDYPNGPDDPYEEPLPEVDAAELSRNKLGLNKKIRLTWESKTLCVSWGTVSGVEGYDVYAAVVGDDFTNATIAKSLSGDDEDSINVKKIDGDSLDKDMYYKVKVRAYRMVDGRKQGIGDSLTMYIAARKDAYYTNVKKIKMKKGFYALKKGKTVKVKPTLVKAAKSKTLLKTPGTKIRYISSNPAIAKVNENGKIKGVKKGSCTIYAIALNGVRKRISVKVK